MTSVSVDGIRISKMIGSVADHVCRTIPIPVMLIKPLNGQRTNKKNLISKIFVPLDGSELSKLALPASEKLAKTLDVPITLFQMALMAQPSGYVTQDASYVDYAQLNAEMKKRDLAEIVLIEKNLKEKGLTVDHIVTSGTNAATEIIQTSKKVNADLMIMSTHGRTGITSWAFGSVAEKVLRYGEIPLMLVNARAS
jgi:nucleotide-binding universal stress UspA family protein